ncbi:MAG: DUF2256 domain-containing protein [Sphingobacteriales bacterium]|nr:DUF2256 domain-containing protein [Sphingobacteriales bacterium]
MPKTVPKSDFPEKICLVCKKPFSWRKKWKNIWTEIKYCSERCRTTKKLKNHEFTQS